MAKLILLEYPLKCHKIQGIHFDIKKVDKVSNFEHFLRSYAIIYVALSYMFYSYIDK